MVNDDDEWKMMVVSSWLMNDGYTMLYWDLPSGYFNLANWRISMFNR